jgi:hypothetical protein
VLAQCAKTLKRLVARQDSNLQPDRYERENIGRLCCFCCAFVRFRIRSLRFGEVVSGAKLVRLACACSANGSAHSVGRSLLIGPPQGSSGFIAEVNPRRECEPPPKDTCSRLNEPGGVEWKDVSVGLLRPAISRKRLLL